MGVEVSNEKMRAVTADMDDEVMMLYLRPNGDTKMYMASFSCPKKIGKLFVDKVVACSLRDAYLWYPVLISGSLIEIFLCFFQVKFSWFLH